MKTLDVLLVLFVLTSFLGCTDKSVVPELQKQNQYLSIQLVKSDSLSNVYKTTIKEIEVVLDSILPGDNTMDPALAGRKLRTRLTQKVNEVNGLLLENEKEYNALNNRLVKSNTRVSEMSEKIKELNTEIRDNENVNYQLTQTVKKHEKQIMEQSTQIESLSREKQRLEKVLETKTITINSAHFIAGSEDELKNKSIIEKTGGFLGLLGRVNTLNPQLNKSHLQMIDIREKTTFTLSAEMEKIELITNHHPTSYELNKTSTGTSLLTVTNPLEFWRNSKNLVITY